MVQTEEEKEIKMLRKQTQKADADSKQNPFVQDITPNKSDVLLIAIAFLIGITFFLCLNHPSSVITKAIKPAIIVE